MKLLNIPLMFLVVLAFAACNKEEEYKVVQPIKRPNQSKTTDRDGRIAEAKKPKKKPERTPRPEVTPVKTPAPEVLQEPLIIMAVDMRADNGQPDGEGGWKLETKGALQTDVKTSLTLTTLEMEMKGDPAGMVWPEVELNFWEKNTKATYFPWGSALNTRDFVTTSSYFNYIKPIRKPIPPGDYLVTFRYYNDENRGNEDRNVYLRKIVVRP